MSQDLQGMHFLIQIHNLQFFYSGDANNTRID